MNTTLSETLSWLFEQYDKKAVLYCVLRNYDLLPAEIPGSDIDVLLDKDSLLINRQILKQMEERFRWTLIWHYKKHYHIEHYTFSKYCSGQKEMTFLRFDFLSDLGWYGTQWLKGTEVLKKRRLHKNAIYVPDRITEVGIILITTILSANKLKERYGNLISEVRLSHRDELFKGLVAVCGENKAKQVWEFLENNRLEEVLLLRKKLRWYFVTKCFLTNFIGHLIDWFDMARIIGVRLIKPPGMMIAFIGPDGAGKSTLIHALCGELEKSFPDIKKKHLRPRLLPDLGQLKAGNNSKKNGKTEWEIRQEKPGRISSLIRLTYYFLDYIVGYWCKIRPLLAQGKIVIFDRYFYDYIVDPFSKNINLPTVLPKFLLHFVPKPHITIALLNTPEIIYSRKNEIPIDEIARQIRAIETLAPTIPNLYKVKNEGNVFDVAQKVMTIIFGRAPLLPHKIPEK